MLSLNEIKNSEYKIILCYPRFSEKEFSQRVRELKKLSVRFLKLDGDKQLGKFQISGKGHASIVVRILSTRGTVLALKARRTDSGKPNMFLETKILLKTNKIGIGPKLHGFTKNFILFDFIEGPTLSEWISSKRRNHHTIKNILSEILKQCHSLDNIRIDHGELSRAHKHIIIGKKNKPVIIDFEKSSDSRRVSNVTSICQYLFVKGKLASETEQTIGKIDKNIFLKLLREYREKLDETSFNKILSALNLKMS